jgi:hypothetical protein
MARENQGLQIALIVSVMLTVVLAGTTYYWYRQYDDAETKAKSNLADATKRAKEAADNASDVTRLKKAIGLAETDKIEAFETTTFKEDMAKFGAGLGEEGLVYRRLLTNMQDTIDKKKAEVDDFQNQVRDLHAQIKVFEASKQPQIDNFQKASEAAAQDRDGERAKFNADRERTTQDEAKLLADVQNIRKEVATEKAKSEAQLTEAGVKFRKAMDVVDRQSTEIEKMTATKIDSFDGDIRWVDQRNSMVWINLGRADSLPRQITFSVYPSDLADLTGSGGQKAKIEVTQILGDHLAEARVLEDTISNPIIPGDKIHTPMWAPGQKKHFALAGFMDLYGDDKSHLQIVMDLIKMNDGVVDAYIDEKTNKIVGAIDVHTRFLILGDDPGEKGIAAQVEPYSTLRNTAKRFGVQLLPLGDMLQRMGWKNQSPVVRYGPGANPKDFAAKPEDGVVKKSTGTVSEVFKQRQAPGGTPAGTTAPAGTPSSTPPTMYHRY